MDDGSDMHRPTDYVGCLCNSCKLIGSELTSISLDGDIIIGAVMPVHMDKIYPKVNYKERPGPAICTTFRLDSYQSAQAVYFTVEEINKTPNLLPNITLGFQIFDSCVVLQRAVSGALQLLSGHGEALPNYRCNQKTTLAAAIGHYTSTYSILLAHILGLYRYPQISHYSTSSLLSDHIQFPSFFRTVPSDAFQSQGLAQLVLQFGWTWIGLVAIDNDYGQQGIQLVKRDIIKAGACVDFTETIISSRQDRNAPHIAQVVKDSTATAVVIFSTDMDLSFVLDEMLRQNVTGKVWIASEAWSTSSFLSVSKYSRLLLGTIGFALHSGSMPGFGDFLNRINSSMVVGNQWIKIIWEQVFGCKFQDKMLSKIISISSIKECTGQESLENIWNNYIDVSNLRVPYNIYTAVHAVAKALDDLGKCRKEDGPFLNGSCADIKNFKPWQYLTPFEKHDLFFGRKALVVNHRGMWERTLFSSDVAPHLDKLVSWGRYIDDILIIWQGTQEDLDTFMYHLNENEYKTNIQSGQSGLHPDCIAKVLQQTLFSMQLQHIHLIINTPYGQFLRARRLCSDDARFEAQAQELKRAKAQNRTILLFSKKKTKTLTDQVRCIIDFNTQSSQLLHYMKKLRLNTSDGRQLFFDENGDPPAVYDIVNWQLSPEGKLQQVKVGSYDTSITSGKIFTINTSNIHWGSGDHGVPVSICSPSCPQGFRKAAIKGQPSCCFQCIPCPSGEIANRTDSLQCAKCPWDMWPNPSQHLCVPKAQEFLSHEDPLGITLTTTGISSSLVPVAIFALFIHYRTTPIVRANNYSLSCLLLLSLLLCFLCSLVFIGYPKNEICILRQVTFGVVFAICVSCILAKTNMVVIAFKATRPGSQLRKWTRPHVSYLIVLSCILIQIFLCIMWLTFSPPFQEVKSESNSGVLVIQCNEGSPLAFWSMLGYLGLLAFISLIVAFLVRRLPDSFNEAKFITFSMLSFLSVWLSYIPASLSSQGKYMVAMEIFAIQSSTWGLVICMFLPKCYIIVFRPNMNSREKLMAKHKK
ncbi:uncharacterized protein LOC130367302 [Hyla sarda]|uniref:uncharacterized protein LOC130367302 n=1 Tax=Hyla sarda TaxID=327740 RepID=UPI0024C4454A|nr:uncharacterized protein LOC130367302 [Hyla sarda]